MKTAYFMPKKSDLLFECKMNSSFWYHGKKLWPKTISNAEHKPIKSTSIGQKEHLYTHLPKWSESFEWLGIGLLPASSPTMLRAASEAGKWRKIKPSSRYRTWFINKADCNYEHIMNYMTWNYTIPKHSNTYHLSLSTYLPFFQSLQTVFSIIWIGMNGESWIGSSKAMAVFLWLSGCRWNPQWQLRRRKWTPGKETEETV